MRCGYVTLDTVNWSLQILIRECALVQTYVVSWCVYTSVMMWGIQWVETRERERDWVRRTMGVEGCGLRGFKWNRGWWRGGRGVVAPGAAVSSNGDGAPRSGVYYYDYTWYPLPKAGPGRTSHPAKLFPLPFPFPILILFLPGRSGCHISRSGHKIHSPAFS